MCDVSDDQPALDPLADLLDVLDLDEAEPTTGTDGTIRDRFVGHSQPTPQHRVFGGQVMGQCIIAAGRSVRRARPADDLNIHSLQVNFLLPGDPEKPLEFVVERLRESRSFSARRVHILQDGVPILASMSSFAVPSGSLDHQVGKPRTPGPEGMSSLVEDLYPMPATEPGNWLLRRAVEIRHVQGHVALEPATPNEVQQVWMKAMGTLPDDPLLHAAVLAYASDWVMMDPVLRRHGVVWTDPRLRVASLDHTMWFHRPIRADEWVLFDQSSPSASGGRGLGVGSMYTADGVLGVMAAQEFMIRIKE